MYDLSSLRSSRNARTQPLGVRVGGCARGDTGVRGVQAVALQRLDGVVYIGWLLCAVGLGALLAWKVSLQLRARVHDTETRLKAFQILRSANLQCIVYVTHHTSDVAR
jgi:hypothetical protein